MKNRTQSRFSFPIIFVLTLMLCAVFPASAIAVEQSRPDMVLRIHGLAPALKVADDIAAATGMQVSPSVLLGGMLQGAAWIDSSRDIVLGAWFDPAHPDGPGSIPPIRMQSRSWGRLFRLRMKIADLFLHIMLKPGRGII